jgi:aspartate carbamoyltransferase catalytic subunit
VNFKGKSIVSMNDFSREDIEQVFRVGESFGEIRRTRLDILKNYVLATLFFEPSTRTRLSFESAMQRLGGGVIGFADPKVARAGEAEPLEDTIRVVENYADVITMRHNEAGAAKRASELSRVPIINGGDGPNEHPTQALLDLYTIKKEKGRIEGLKIALVGDLFHLRTLRSLAYGMCRFDVQLFLVSPPELRLKEDVMVAVKESGRSYRELTDIREIIGQIDVLYTDYFPKGRFEDLTLYEKYKMEYRFDRDALKGVKEDFIILHPMPRKDSVGYQIYPDVDSLNCARYFKQVFNGVRIRMALLAMVLGER